MGAILHLSHSHPLLWVGTLIFIQYTQFDFIRNPVNFSVVGFLNFLLLQPVFVSYLPKFPWSLFLKFSSTRVIPRQNLTNFELISLSKNKVQQNLRNSNVKTQFLRKKINSYMKNIIQTENIYSLRFLAAKL